MGYLIVQILFWLLLAALIGFLIAWRLRGAAPDVGRASPEADFWEPAHARTSGTQLEDELREARAACEACEAELARLRAQLDRKTLEPAPAAGPPAAAEAGRPALLAAARGTADDLKRISGIGPKIEKTLHELGVFHFDQIAAWTPDNVAWVNEHLRFRGRIQRERWIEQAREFADAG